MYNYFNQILDQYDEKLVNEKIAEDLGELPESDDQYALIIKQGSDILRKYPIDTVENVAFSYIAFEKNRGKLSDSMAKIAETNISKMLDFYGVEHDLQQYDITTNTYMLTQADLNKLAAQPSPKKEFAIEYGEKTYLPLDTVSDFDNSLSEFKLAKHKLPVLIRKEASQRFIERGIELNKPVPELAKYASFEIASPQQMRAAMATRFLSYTPKIKEYVTEAIDQIKTAEDALHAIGVITEIDKELNIIPQKHFDLAEWFFQKPKQADINFSEKLQSALDNNELDSYLDKEIVDELRDGGEAFYNQLNPRIKSVILNIVSK